MTKRLILRILLGGVLLILLSVSVVFFLVSRKGSGTIEEWVGSQIQTIAGSFLKPKLTFTDLDYSYPLTVSLKNLKLTADDPSAPGTTVDIIACTEAAVTLGEIPAIGKPIIIEKIILRSPQISAIAARAGTQEFIGFSDLLSDPSADADTSNAEPIKLSDAFRMRLIELADGKIVYDPRLPGTVPMALDQINTTLTIEPTSVGQYKLATVIARKPVFHVEVAGQLDLDTFTARDIAIALAADLGSDKLDYLPPELQKLLKQYDAKGKLNVQLSGTMPVMDPLKGNVRADVTLDRANVSFGDFRAPVESLGLTAQFADGKVLLPSLKISALSGTAELSGSATLNERLDANLRLKVAGMMLEDMLAAGPSAMAPRMDLEMFIGGSLTTLLGTLPVEKGTPVASLGVKNFRYYAPDPANPQQTIDVLACKALDIALAAPIVEGKPIVVEKIILNEPSIAAIAVAPNSLQFVGVPTLPPSVTEPATAPTPPEAPTPPGGAVAKISDLIRVNTFQLNDARVIYDPRIAGTKRMWVAGINTKVDIDAANPGQYLFSTGFGRKPVFDYRVGGAVDVDALELQSFQMNLNADLTQNQLDFLPPQLQAVLQQNDAKGKVAVQVTGAVPFKEPLKASAQVGVSLDNINLVAEGARVPVESLKLSASLANGRLVLPNLTIFALQSVFDISGSAVLNDRLDTELTVKLKDVVIENLVAALPQGKDIPKTTTKLNAEIMVQSPVLVALGKTPAVPAEPVAALTVRDLRLTVDDPIQSGKPLDFVSLDRFGVTVSSLPKSGNPILIDRVVLSALALRAVAIEAGSNELAGITNLLAIADAFSTARAAGADKADGSAVNTKLSQLVRVKSFELTDASLYYNPQIEDTVPFSLNNISTSVKLDSLAGDAYAFRTSVPAKPHFNVDASGRVNVDELTADGLKISMLTDLGQRDAAYLPPQLQQLQKTHDLEGLLSLDVSGSVPFTDPTRGALRVDVKLDNVKATAANYRLPIEHVRLPIELKDRKVYVLDADKALGGKTIELFGGTAAITSVVELDDQLTTDLSLTIDNLALEKFAETKIEGEKPELIGNTHVVATLDRAPLLTILQLASAVGSGAESPPQPEADTETAVGPSTLPSIAADPPAKWGRVDIEVTDARLAGFELIQMLGNAVKTAFVDPFKDKGKRGPNEVKPNEYAFIKFDLVSNRVLFEEIYYEGEVVAVEMIGEKGYITLDQRMLINLGGGPIARLGTAGRFGKWLKDATNSLIYYKVSSNGPLEDYKFEAKFGDGKPIGSAVKKGANVAGKGIKKGVDATGGFFKKITGGMRKKPADE